MHKSGLLPCAMRLAVALRAGTYDAHLQRWEILPRRPWRISPRPAAQRSVEAHPAFLAAARCSAPIFCGSGAATRGVCGVAAAIASHLRPRVSVAAMDERGRTGAG